MILKYFNCLEEEEEEVASLSLLFYCFDGGMKIKRNPDNKNNKRSLLLVNLNNHAAIEKRQLSFSERRRYSEQQPLFRSRVKRSSGLQVLLLFKLFVFFLKRVKTGNTLTTLFCCYPFLFCFLVQKEKLS